MKTEERQRARELRHDHGLSVREIARTVGVSRSSVSLWVRDVPLTEAQLRALHDRNPAYNHQLRGASRNAELGRARRSGYQEQGRELARRGEAFHAAGTMLYWAEGSRSRNSVQFTNSDPEMVALFVRFLRAYYSVPDESFRVACNLFADHADDQARIEGFWLDTLGLPSSCLRKTTVNVYSKHSKKKRLNRLPYGTCSVRVHSTQLIQSIYGAIQEYRGFDRPEWLD
jgi:transcriptional regulator with XRE-family HTH domain